MNEIFVDVSRDGVISAMRNAFTTSFTVVAELMQNARRAGATRIDIRTKGLWLEIRDDGAGVEDFANLVNLGTSGWDAHTQAAEAPFGLGFGAALYAADRVVVESGRRIADIDTARALAFEPIEVSASDHTEPGTRIQLWLNPEGRNTGGLEGAVRKYARGFAIAVLLNGERVDRPHALGGNLTFADTPVGPIALPALDAEQAWRIPPQDFRRVVYVQGLPVQERWGWGGSRDRTIVVHAEGLAVRMPDRTVFVDEAAAKTRIEEAISDLWRERLLAQKSRLGPAAFAEQFWPICAETGNGHLLADVPLVRSMFQCYTDVITQTTEYLEDQYPVRDWPADSPVPGEADIVLNGLANACEDQLENLYVWQRQLPILKSEVPESIRSRLTHLLEHSDLPIRYEPHGDCLETHFCGQLISTDVLVCEAITIDFDAERAAAEGTDALEGLLPPLMLEQAMFWDFQKGLVITRKEPDLYDAADLVSSFVDETDHYQSTSREADSEALAGFLAGVRSGDPAAYLRSQLERLSFDRRFLGEGVYRLQWNNQERGFDVVCEAA